MASAIQLLKEQHAEVSALFQQIERAGDPRLRAQIFRTIDTSLRVHSTLEETLFYPAFKEHAKGRMQEEEVAEALHEHAEVKETLQRIEGISPASESFLSTVMKLKSLVLQHVAEEESGMLKQAPRLFTTRELDDLGFRMEHAAMHTSPVYEMSGKTR